MVERIRLVLKSIKPLEKLSDADFNKKVNSGIIGDVMWAVLERLALEDDNLLGDLDVQKLFDFQNRLKLTRKKNDTTQKS